MPVCAAGTRPGPQSPAPAFPSPLAHRLPLENGIESPVTIHAGEVSTSAAINITGNPRTNGTNDTVPITVQASIATAIGPPPATPVTFTLTGGFFAMKPS
jgi:hypothetical protein